MKLILTLAVAAFVAAQQGDPVVNVSKEPRHKVVFESGSTRVQDVQIPAGDTSLYHTHDYPMLYVPITDAPLRTQVLGGEWSGGGGRSGGPSAAPAGPGRVTSTISYAEKPLTHRVGNVGASMWRRIAIGNLSKGSEATTDDVSRLGTTPEVINRYYRAFRVSLPPGAATAAHQHAWPVVVVQQTAGQLSIEGAAKTLMTEPGKFAFHDGGEHVVRNTGTAAIELVEIEVRGGSGK
jgi:quercetin dioxygenase-like cupin family protein